MHTTREFHQMLVPALVFRHRILAMAPDIVMETRRILASIFQTGIRKDKVSLARLRNSSSIQELARYLSNVIHIFMAGTLPPMHPYLILNPERTWFAPHATRVSRQDLN